MIKLTSYQKGIIAELLAKIYLILHGYKILQKRYKQKVGEIDIIAIKKNTVHFVEVKQRKDENKARDSISKKNKYRVMKCSQMFLQKNKKYKDFDLSFDFISVIFPLKIVHLKNSWSENDV